MVNWLGEEVMLATLLKLVTVIKLVNQVEEEVRESKEALKKVQSRLLQLGSSLTFQQATEQLNKVDDVTFQLTILLSLR